MGGGCKKLLAAGHLFFHALRADIPQPSTDVSGDGMGLRAHMLSILLNGLRGVKSGALTAVWINGSK